MKDSRLKLVVILFLVAGGLMIARLFYLQIFRYNYYHQQAEKSRSVERFKDAKRGEDRRTSPLSSAT